MRRKLLLPMSMAHDTGGNDGSAQPAIDIIVINNTHVLLVITRCQRRNGLSSVSHL